MMSFVAQRVVQRLGAEGKRTPGGKPAILERRDDLPDDWSPTQTNVTDDSGSADEADEPDEADGALLLPL